MNWTTAQLREHDPDKTKYPALWHEAERTEQQAKLANAERYRANQSGAAQLATLRRAAEDLRALGPEFRQQIGVLHQNSDFSDAYKNRVLLELQNVTKQTAQESLRAAGESLKDARAIAERKVAEAKQAADKNTNWQRLEFKTKEIAATLTRQQPGFLVNDGPAQALAELRDQYHADGDAEALRALRVASREVIESTMAGDNTDAKQRLIPLLQAFDADEAAQYNSLPDYQEGQQLLADLTHAEAELRNAYSAALHEADWTAWESGNDALGAATSALLGQGTGSGPFGAGQQNPGLTPETLAELQAATW